MAELTKEYAGKPDILQGDNFQSAKNITNEDDTHSGKNPQTNKALLSGVFTTTSATNGKPTAGTFSFGGNNQTSSFIFGQKSESERKENSVGGFATSGFSFEKGEAPNETFTFGGSTIGAGSG